MSTQFYNKCAKHNEHEKNHMCQIILTRDLDKIRKLLVDSKYYCKNCGRAAHDKANLCNPTKI